MVCNVYHWKFSRNKLTKLGDAIAISNMKLLGYAIACKNKQCHRLGYLITNGVGKS